MSYGIIFIGRGELNVEDFARFVEKHYICEEYLVQSSAYIKVNLILFQPPVFVQNCFIKEIRESIAQLRESAQFLQYVDRYKRMVVSNKVTKVCNVQRVSGERVKSDLNITTYYLSSFSCF